MSVRTIPKNMITVCQHEPHLSVFFQRQGNVLFTEETTLEGLSPDMTRYAQDQCEYLTTRSVEDLVLLYMYTTGVYRVLNTYIRTGTILDEQHDAFFFAWCSVQFQQDRYATASYDTMFQVFRGERVTSSLLDHYVRILNRIMHESPVLPFELTVSRGTKAEIEQTGFISTSLHKDISSSMFAGKECCVYRMHLPQGTHALFMLAVSYHPHEYEYLLPTGGVFQVTTQVRKPLPSEYEPDRTMMYISVTLIEQRYESDLERYYREMEEFRTQHW